MMRSKVLRVVRVENEAKRNCTKRNRTKRNRTVP